jgi:hypothetical protein
MRPIRSIGTVAALAATLSSYVGVAPVFAHHSFGLFDMGKTAEIEGTVIKFEWSNPHCWLFLASGPSSDTAAVNYGFELTSVGEMIRRGWTKTSVKPGDKIKVTFHPVRDGRPAGYMMSVMTEDGRYVGRPPEMPNVPAAPQPPPSG